MGLVFKRIELGDNVGSDVTYKFGKQIGKGGFGVVYEVEKGRSNDAQYEAERFAGKLLRIPEERTREAGSNSDVLERNKGAWREDIERFRDEFIKQRRMATEHSDYFVVPIDYCWVVQDGVEVPCIIMDRMSGSLADVFACMKKSPIQEKITKQERLDIAYYVTRRVLEGLSRLEENTKEGELDPMINFDIKPSNILVGGEGRIFLSDFGGVFPLSESKDARIQTNEDNERNTPGGAKQGERNHVYPVGEMLLCFISDKELERKREEYKQEEEQIWKRKKEVIKDAVNDIRDNSVDNVELYDWLINCLDKTVGSRFRSASEAFELFRACFTNEGTRSTGSYKEKQRAWLKQICAVHEECRCKKEVSREAERLHGLNWTETDHQGIGQDQMKKFSAQEPLGNGHPQWEGLRRGASVSPRTLSAIPSAADPIPSPSTKKSSISGAGEEAGRDEGEPSQNHRGESVERGFLASVWLSIAAAVALVLVVLQVSKSKGSSEQDMPEQSTRSTDVVAWSEPLKSIQQKIWNKRFVEDLKEVKKRFPFRGQFMDEVPAGLRGWLGVEDSTQLRNDLEDLGVSCSLEQPWLCDKTDGCFLAEEGLELVRTVWYLRGALSEPLSVTLRVEVRPASRGPSVEPRLKLPRVAIKVGIGKRRNNVRCGEGAPADGAEASVLLAGRSDSWLSDRSAKFNLRLLEMDCAFVSFEFEPHGERRFQRITFEGDGAVLAMFLQEEKGDAVWFETDQGFNVKKTFTREIQEGAKLEVVVTLALPNKANPFTEILSARRKGKAWKGVEQPTFPLFQDLKILESPFLEQVQRTDTRNSKE